MSKQYAPVARAGLLGVAATMMFAGAFAQEAIITAVGAGLSVGSFILVFRSTLRGFMLSFYR
jgi:hypothetical protein